jgi:hypothetical protein
MKGLVVVACLAVVATTARADSLDCCRVECCSTPAQAWGVVVSGHCANVADGTFGLRTIDVRELQSPAEGGYVDAQNTAWRGHVPGAGDYAAEAGGALVGGILVGAGAGLAGGFAGLAIWGPGDDPWPVSMGFWIGEAGGFVLGYPCGCALGTTTVGSWLKCKGNTGGAYAGAYLVLLAAIPLALAGRGAFGPLYAIPPVLLFAPAGAVIGYNRGVQRTSSPSSLGARLAPPTIAYRTRLGPDRKTYSAFDCRLVTVRF